MRGAGGRDGTRGCAGPPARSRQYGAGPRAEAWRGTAMNAGRARARSSTSRKGRWAACASGHPHAAANARPPRAGVWAAAARTGGVSPCVASYSGLRVTCVRGERRRELLLVSEGRVFARLKVCEILRLFAIFWRASLNLHGAHPLGNARQHDQLAPHSQFLRRRRLSTMVLGYPTSDEQPRSELPWVGCKARFV